ncbi:MAG: HD domain-containing protein [Treponema sp.]|nr:HD domain-containing protein [Treponema sp.]
MKKNTFVIGLFVILCLTLNLVGKTFADALQLPLWLDSLGTVIVAYAFGPICGSIVGVTTNLVYSVSDPVSAVYSITSVAIGVIVGLTARRRWFETVFGTMTASVLVTLVAVVVSVSVSLVRTEGMTGNLWGDGVIGLLHEEGMPFWMCAVIGEFYIDFLDKVITLFFLFFVIKIYRNRKFFFIKMHRLIKNRSVRAIVLFAGIGLCSVYPAEASNINTYVQTIYSSHSGLPCGEANDIAQTNDGILWIGTYAGLYRYNGSEFRWMKEFSSVRNVNCLYVDEEGRLWIGTNDNGVAICINEHIVNVLDNSKALPSNSVRGIVKSTDGFYYVGTTMGMMAITLDGGLHWLNTITEIGYTVSIDADKNGNVAVVTSDGRLSIIRNRQVVFSDTVGRGKEIYTCCTFVDNVLYAGTSQNHVYQLHVNDIGFERKKVMTCGNSSHINKLYLSAGRMFVCSDMGIGYLSDYAGKEEYVSINTGGFNNSIDSMEVDYQGNYWFASSRQGLLKLSPSSFTNLYGSLGMTPHVVNTITRWDDTLYIGTDNGLDAIRQNNPIQNTLTHMFEGVRIRCMKVDSKGNLWVCTYGKGLIEILPGGKTITYDSTNDSFGDWTRVVIELSDGTIVAASDTGIAYIQNQKVVQKITTEDGLPNVMILTLLEIQPNIFLAGTDGDGIAVIQDGKVIRQLTLKDGLTSGVILRTVTDYKHEGVFIVTSNSLCYMDFDFNVRVLDTFPYNNNYDIWISRSGQLFVLGSAGIHVVARDTLLSESDVLQYTLLDAKSGLSSALTANSWNYCDENENLYLSSGTGVYMVNLENYLSTKRSYRMMLASIKLDNEQHRLERGEPFIIGRKVQKIEFFPEVINFSVLDPLVCYYLEGFDASPQVIQQSELTSVTYTNLSSGKYVFHLSVIDNKNTVLEQSQYEFIKAKAIYDNQWFKIYMLIVALIAVAWFTWFIARTQIQRTIDLQRQRLELAEEQVRMGNETILAIAKTVDAKDENTSQHSMRVSEYSVLIGKELGFDDTECENLRKAALLHDIGKIGVPDRILNKPARLDDDEYKIMKTHVVKGAEILKDFTMIQNVSDGAHYHHERWDGTGYAEGLKGEDIPVYARIIGIADAFDAMTANRVYRKKLAINQVLDEIKRGRGSQFDPNIADILLGLVSSGKIDMKALYEDTSAGGNE